LERAKQGVFYGQSKHNNPLELSTDGFGIAIVNSFITSEISGSYLITAFLMADETIRDTVNLIVKVPDLVELGTGEQYELVGAPNNHAGTNDPCRPDPPKSEHSRNHFGTGALIAAIQSIAAAYESLHPGVRLRVNDISLEQGGLFDNFNDWIYHPNQTHGEHRNGKSADIAFSGINSNKDCVQRLALQDLSELIEQYTDDDTYMHHGDKPHYHIRVR
jgi:hypothetical protein